MRSRLTSLLKCHKRWSVEAGTTDALQRKCALTFPDQGSQTGVQCWRPGATLASPWHMVSAHLSDSMVIQGFETNTYYTVKCKICQIVKNKKVCHHHSPKPQEGGRVKSHSFVVGGRAPERRLRPRWARENERYSPCCGLGHLRHLASTILIFPI